MKDCLMQMFRENREKNVYDSLKKLDASLFCKSVVMFERNEIEFDDIVELYKICSFYPYEIAKWGFGVDFDFRGCRKFHLEVLNLILQDKFLEIFGVNTSNCRCYCHICRCENHLTPTEIHRCEYCRCDCHKNKQSLLEMCNILNARSLEVFSICPRRVACHLRMNGKADWRNAAKWYFDTFPGLKLLDKLDEFPLVYIDVILNLEQTGNLPKFFKGLSAEDTIEFLSYAYHNNIGVRN